jgi:hypothetical protein
MTKQIFFVLTLGDQNSQRWKRFISENSIKNGSIPPPVTRIKGWKWIKQGDDADLHSKKNQQIEYEQNIHSSKFRYNDNNMVMLVLLY